MSHSASRSSEIGGLFVLTMNFNNFFLQNEGLTQTTQHELSHLLGLSHPHDYWDPVLKQLFDENVEVIISEELDLDQTERCQYFF
ncbi:MAG: hypothetical protein ACXACU_04120 [Candidatus Hodarchaeales archaeon]